MTKIMLVEDDQSLREIYSIRLVAEGYEVVSAGDGEEALALAVRERPNLVVSDVMMPKISGFDMLDILRSTPETKDIHVIMMTALSSEDQRRRGEALGADKYLVKSQVGIEDVVNAVHEVLGDGATAGATSSSESAQAAPTVAAPAGSAAADFPTGVAPSVALPNSTTRPAGSSSSETPLRDSGQEASFSSSRSFASSPRAVDVANNPAAAVRMSQNSATQPMATESTGVATSPAGATAATARPMATESTWVAGQPVAPASETGAMPQQTAQ